MRPRQSDGRRTLARISLVALCVGLEMGCGSTGEPLDVGAQTGGVAPWQDIGPMVFCDGALRLGDPDSAPSGFCVDEKAVPHACAADSDCGSRERCTCAGCEVVLCSTGDECGPGWTCTLPDGRCDRPCTRDADCAGGDACPAGVGACRGRCAASRDCQHGEVCDKGRCATTPGGDGAPCRVDSDCFDHPFCTLQRVPGDLREPAPIIDDKLHRLVLYVERVDAAGSAIWRAVSDGDPADPAALAGLGLLRFRFDPPGPVIAPAVDDLRRAGAPSLIGIADGSRVALFADGRARLRRATSADGILFTIDPRPILEASHAWDAAGLDAPSLARDPGAASRWLLYYATADRHALGLAHSDDGIHFSPEPDPVLTPSRLVDPTLWRDVDRIASPFVEARSSPDPSLRVYFAAHGRESEDATRFGAPAPIPANYSVGEASTLEGSTLVPWPWNPAFDRAIDFVLHPSEMEPAIVSLQSGLRLIMYRDAAADGSHPHNLRAARNP